MLNSSSSILLIGTFGTLGLVLGNTGTRTSDLLSLVLRFLDRLSGCFFRFCNTLADHSVLWFEFDHGFFVVVNQTEPGALAATKLGSESEQDSEFRISLVHVRQKLGEFILGYIRPSRVNDIHNHLWKLSNEKE